MTIIDGPITLADLVIGLMIAITFVIASTWIIVDGSSDPEKGRIAIRVICAMAFLVSATIAYASSPPIQRAKAEITLGIDLRDCYALHADAERKRRTSAMYPNQYRRAATCFYQRELLAAHVAGESPWSWWPTIFFGGICLVLVGVSLRRQKA